MNTLSRSKPVLVLFVGVFFGFAPLWAPHVQQVWGRNLFATPDSMVLLGVTLLVSLLAYYLLPDFFVTSHLRGSIRHPPSAIRFFAAVFGLSSVVLLIWALYLINQHILHSFLSSADEHSCYFLAECLRKGKLFVEMPQHADFFKVVHVGMRDGKWFSVYPPGWPLIWAFGLNFNIVDWLNPAISALAILFLFLSGKRLFGLWATVFGLLVCILNPFFAFTAASYFSHATCLLCIGVFLYAFLRWREDYAAGKDPIGWAALCALAVGYGLMTRYLTMAAVVGPFLLYHYLPIFFGWKGWRKGDSPPNDFKGTVPFMPFTFKRPRLRKSDWIFLGIVVLFMAIILYQNYLVTGKAFRAPNKHDKSWERLGFRSNYTPVDAFFYLIARIFYLMDWFAPAIVGAYLVLLFNTRCLKAFLTPGVDGVKVLFRLTPVFIAFAYFFYYSWGGNQWGPRYLWEGMPFLCIAVADWLVRLWRDRGLRVKKFVLAFMITSVATSAILFMKHAEFTEEASRQRRALYDLAEQTIQGQGIVFIRGFIGDRLVLAEEDAVRNSPFLESRILYVHDLGDRNKELMAAYPGRAYFRGTYDRGRLQPQIEGISSI